MGVGALSCSALDLAIVGALRRRPFGFVPYLDTEPESHLSCSPTPDTFFRPTELPYSVPIRSALALDCIRERMFF